MVTPLNTELLGFILPVFSFILVYAMIFAILQKTKIFGDDRKQLNALLSFVIGLIFVGVAYPTEIVNNLVIFLAVAVVVMFVVLILWGFVSGVGLEKDLN